MNQFPSVHEALSAIAIGFEACEGESPSIVGWSLRCDDGTERFGQRVIERGLWPAPVLGAHVSDHPLSSGACSLTRSVADICELAETEGRTIIVWQDHELDAVRRFVRDESLVARLESLSRVALPVAEHWQSVACREPVSMGAGVDTLGRFVETLGLPGAKAFGSPVAEVGIRAMRGGLRSTDGAPERVERGVNELWRRALGRNRARCSAIGEVYRRLVLSLEMAAAMARDAAVRPTLCGPPHAQGSASTRATLAPTPEAQRQLAIHGFGLDVSD